MSRRAAREEAFKLLYQMDIHKEDKDEVLETFFKENNFEDGDKAYIQDVVTGTMKHIDEINSLIEKNTIGWKINRISKVNMAILRLAVFEMLKREDIPMSVSINEAVELAKTYDNVESGAFINGVLGSISKQLQVRS
ncbi:MAG: transcription antitermination protein NusB [Petroclostridium sp.]|jgi:N utilization substance protein B|uniref:transcription antitermination factor NusB n=1 Tax=Petroclostridium xylanilyticum TaxID=1792311 RepID=UPI000B981FF2|nr:transcription antitermination factor NusB [Petroclostridium xylanilyticum]MDK2810348.1 transcription antitermination protein NusB [Petroclostridium sp.]